MASTWSCREDSNTFDCFLIQVYITGWFKLNAPDCVRHDCRMQ